MAGIVAAAPPIIGRRFSDREIRPPMTTADDTLPTWPLRAAARARRPAATSTPSTWKTPEGIAVKPLYTAADLEGLRHRHAAGL